MEVEMVEMLFDLVKMIISIYVDGTSDCARGTLDREMSMPCWLSSLTRHRSTVDFVVRRCVDIVATETGAAD